MKTTKTKSTRKHSQMQRLDKGFARYLARRAKREGRTLVELTRLMLAAIQQEATK